MSTTSLRGSTPIWTNVIWTNPIWTTPIWSEGSFGLLPFGLTPFGLTPFGLTSFGLTLFGLTLTALSPNSNLYLRNCDTHSQAGLARPHLDYPHLNCLHLAENGQKTHWSGENVFLIKFLLGLGVFAIK